MVHNFVLNIDYFVIFYFSLSYCHCLHYFYARAPFSFHTLIRSLLTTLDLHVHVIGHLLILFRCSCDRTLREEIRVSPLFLVFLPLIILVSILFLISCISDSVFIPVLLYDIMRGCLYVILQWYWFIVVDFVPCSGYFMLNVYTWVFSSRIYIADLRRDSVFAYFGKWGVTGFSWYQRQVQHKKRI